VQPSTQQFPAPLPSSPPPHTPSLPSSKYDFCWSCQATMVYNIPYICPFHLETMPCCGGWSMTSFKSNFSKESVEAAKVLWYTALCTYVPSILWWCLAMEDGVWFLLKTISVRSLLKLPR
jgi:hypothetical protein